MFVLLSWVNVMLHRPREAHDLHLVFADGLTLCLVLQRLLPGTRPLVRFKRAVTRGPALSNIEQALAHIWQLSPQSSAMPTAQQVLDGTPREVILRFISELYSMFVVAPARAQLPIAMPWLQYMVAPYALALSASALNQPHATLGMELRSGTALACVLHALLMPSRTPGLDGGVFCGPKTEEERAVNARVVFGILARERLAPCSAEEFLRAGLPAAERAHVAPCGLQLEEEILLITLSAMHRRFTNAASPQRGRPPSLRFRDGHMIRRASPLCSMSPPTSSAPCRNKLEVAEAWGREPAVSSLVCGGSMRASLELMSAGVDEDDAGWCAGAEGTCKADAGTFPRGELPAPTGSSSGLTASKTCSCMGPFEAVHLSSSMGHPQHGAGCGPCVGGSCIDQLGGGLVSAAPAPASLQNTESKTLLLAEVDAFLRGEQPAALTEASEAVSLTS